MPSPSPSRTRAARYDGNRRYFARPDRLWRWRFALAGVAAAVAVGWAAYDRAGPSQTALYAHSHGPLTGAHANWDGDCAACHQPRAAADFLADPAAALRVKERWLDLTCEKCHAGPPHHRTVADGGAFHAACGNCHHDHGGRANSLVRLADHHCTRCHADLPAHTAGPTAYHPAVTDFAADHPEFRPLTGAPDRTLKFSHALHMSPGLPRTPGGKEALTGDVLRRLFGDAAARRYETPGKPDALVQLTCGSCHQLQAAGAYYGPVTFDAHCRDCHPLAAPDGAVGGAAVGGFELPHRRQPADLLPLLAGRYARRLGDPDRRPAPPPPGPGGRLDPHPDPVARSAAAEADRLGADALALLVGGSACGKCHDLPPAADPARAVVPPVPDRTVWFRHGRFDHAAHRNVGCGDCHPGTAGPLAAGPLVEKEPVQITGADSCRRCHAPAGRTASAGVRHGCTDCHRYHAGDR